MNATATASVAPRPAQNRVPAAMPRQGAAASAVMHIFSDDPATGRAAADALQDRRLAKIRAELHDGGVLAARAMFAASPTPDLLLVESRGDVGALLDELETLAQVCDARTKVIVIGHVNDVRLYRELMRRHITEYLVAPLGTGQLAEAVAGALAGHAAETTGRVVAFLGAKGGCGSSTVCHNVGWSLADALGLPTIIADFDLAFGTLGLDFNQDAAQGLGEALAAGSRLDGAMLEKLMSKCSDLLTLLTPPCVTDAADASPEQAAHLVQLLGRAAGVVALDLPLGWRASTRALVAEADHVVVTAEPDLANLRNAKNLIDTVRVLRGDDAPPLLVLNKLQLPRRPEISAHDFANAVELEPSALIEFDAQLFGTAANNGLMIGEVSAKSRHAQHFRSLAGKLTGNAAIASRPAGRLKPLMRRLTRRLAS